MSLRSLPPLLRDEGALTEVVGSANAVLAVPGAARAFVIAGLASVSGRDPIVVAVPSAAEAERLAHDLSVWLGPGEVESFPAWETLPFERVSPSVETMGRRLRARWHLATPAGVPAGSAGAPRRHPRVLVAPIKALVQRLGPPPPELAPIVVRPGDALDAF